MQNKHDITLTCTLDVTFIYKADEPGRPSDKVIECGFLRPDHPEFFSELIKRKLGADDVTLRDLKLFIHDGNSQKEAAK